MDNLNELFYQVDENDQVIGSVTREKAHDDPSKIHRSICVLATNKDKQMLFQQRSQYKDLNPGLWTLACGGHVTYGESYLQAAEREVFEELGIHPHLYFVSKLLIKTPQESEQCQIYMCRIESLPTQFDKREVAAVQFVDIDQIEAFVADHPLSQGDSEILRLLLYLPSNNA